LQQEQHYRLRGFVGGAVHYYPLASGDNRIGSERGNSVILAVRGVSREHALLCLGSDGLTIEDLGSKNGTRVNKKRIDQARLEPGDEIHLGPVTLQLEKLDAGDAELGLALPLPEAAPISGRPAGDTSAVADHAPSRAAWLQGLEFPKGYVPGDSPAIYSLYEQMRPLLQGDVPVLILGETGVGKEYLARILHDSSPRRRGPFVAINCAAIPAELLEAEMFGIGKGVATGVVERQGKFQLAAGGTLFLDEIGEMPFELQAKLLRALQDKEIHPVGSPRAIPVALRVLAATNSDLLERVEAGRFRSDLYYRVAGGVLQVPPLRQRKQDIPSLVEAFIHACEARKSVRGVTVKALRALVDYPWPGNIRELEHEVRRLVELCPNGQAIDSTLLSKQVVSGAEPLAEEEFLGDSLRLDSRVEQLEARLIREALTRAGGNRSQAAKLLGISRNGLAIKMKRLGIKASVSAGT
jgi:transcriptional regulator with GAF, ATPase, and Fis domain